MAFLNGWLIEGDRYQYKIEKTLGKGGFGIMCLASHYTVALLVKVLFVR